MGTIATHGPRIKPQSTPTEEGFNGKTTRKPDKSVQGGWHATEVEEKEVEEGMEYEEQCCGGEEEREER